MPEFCHSAEPTPMRDHCFEGLERDPRSLRVCLAPPPTVFSSPKTLRSNTLEVVWKDALPGGRPPESVGPGRSLCMGPVVLSAIPDEVFAGRLCRLPPRKRGAWVHVDNDAWRDLLCYRLFRFDLFGLRPSLPLQSRPAQIESEQAIAQEVPPRIIVDMDPGSPLSRG